MIIPFMHPVRRLLPCLVVLAVWSRAQTPAEPPVQSPAVIVVSTPLAADAGGMTRIQFDETAPAIARSFTGLTNRVANLHLNAGGAGSFGDILSLRGLANTPFFSDPSITLYFDDLPLGNTFAYPTALFGFGAATVERGPQGTALGRGGPGGTIVFSSTEPGARPSGEVRAGFGNYNTHSAAVEARSARAEKVDAVVSAAFNERDGYISNTELGTRVDDQQVFSASARVRFRPGTASEITFQLLGTTHRDGAQPLVPLGAPRFSVARGREGSTDSNFVGGAIKAQFDTALGRITSTTSHTQWKLDPYDNRLVLPPALDSRVVQSQRIWNEELRLASTSKGPLTWHIAGWFSDGTTRGNIDRGIVLPFGAIPIEASDFRLRSRTQAFFSEIHLASVSDWHFMTGIRAEHTRRDFRRSQSVPGPGRFSDAKSFDSVQPKFTASYDLHDNATVSASIALASKPGGWSAYTENASLARFSAEETLAFELGFDTTYLDKTVAFAARAFVYSIEDYQIERSFTATDYLVVNAPRARSFGGEIEASWRPTSAFTFTATLGMTSVTLREFTEPYTNTLLNGNRAPYTPDFDMHLSATYRTPTGWYAAGELAMVGQTYFEESQAPAFKTTARETANARIGYGTTRWRAGAYIENIGNEGYYSLIIPGVGHAVPGAPRTYGIEAAWKW